MIKNLLTAMIVLTSLSCLTAQQTTKLDLRSWQRLKAKTASNELTHLLVKGDLEKIKWLAAKYGGTYKYGYSNVASVSIPEKNIEAFTAETAIAKVADRCSKAVFLMDTARIRNNIDSAQTGYAPLPDSMVGKNVLIGIIDGGIYWQHQDFKNADGTTRIRYIWNQSIPSSNPPLPYNYGTEWSFLDINGNTCTELVHWGGSGDPCASDFSHGTCVAGAAAGNGSSLQSDSALAGKYVGVAPQSQLIIVDIGTSGPANGNCTPANIDFLTQISDAVDYIFKKADAMGMPCVVNTSVGTYYGSHDGIDPTTQIIEALLEQRNGRVLVAAGGNGGNVAQHLSYTVPSDSSNAAYTFFDYIVPFAQCYFDLWADTAKVQQCLVLRWLQRQRRQ